MSDLKNRITEDMKSAMRAKEKERLGAIRLILAAMKQKEVDERVELTDEHIIVILDKLAKQRKESITHYKEAKRDDLVATEAFELELIQSYLPAQLSEAEVMQIIQKGIQETQATSIKDMGKVMGVIRPQLQGRTDMGQVSALIKQQLSA